jgi:RNA polymerase sigma-70 factor (ECF subfamily)
MQTMEDTARAMQGKAALRSTLPGYRGERARTTTTRREETSSTHAIVAALPSLREFARQLGIGNREDERDLVQDTIVRALSATAGVAGHVPTMAWLITIMRNLHVDRARRRNREPSHLSLDEVGTDSDEMASGSPIRGRVDIFLLLAALEALPKEFRGPFESYAIQGMSYREIAKEYGVSLATVGTRLHRTRAKLKEVLLNRI